MEAVDRYRVEVAPYTPLARQENFLTHLDYCLPFKMEYWHEYWHKPDEKDWIQVVKFNV